MQIMRVALLLAAWSCSWCFTLSKANWKKGPVAFRILQTGDAANKAWPTAAHRRGKDLSSARSPNSAYGCVEGKSREEAVAAQQALAWRARDIGKSTVISFYDAANAVGRTQTRRVGEGAGNLYKHPDGIMLAEQVARTVTRVPTAEGQCDCQLGSGVPRGHTVGPDLHG